MRISFAFVLGSLLVPSVSFAFRAEPSGAGRPPDLGRRDLDRVPNAARQAMLSASPAWRRFLADHPGPWRVTWDDRAGTPREIAGASIALLPARADATEVERASRAFLRTLQPLSGVAESLLRTETVRRVGDTWFVRFERLTARGVPVDGAFAELRICAGRVVLIRLETHPLADGAALPRLSIAEGKARAHARLREFLAPGVRLASTAHAVVVPIAEGDRWTYKPGWSVESRADRAGRWRSIVDAEYGEVLARESHVRWAVEGSVYGEVEPRTIGDTPEALPLPFLRATVADTAVDADADGRWSWGGGEAPAPVTLRLAGPFVSVRNRGGADASVSFTASTTTANDFTFDTTNATRSEIAGYRHAETVRQWALGVVPGLAWLQGTLPVNVRLDDQCNAYWDGESMNFFREGSSCNDTARIADVVYHEFGHGFHQNNLVSGVMDYAIGEGSGDYIAATITGSPFVGPYFFKDGGEVREIETDRVYPGDLVGESHEDGLIWAGAMWDLRKALIAKLGDVEGRAHSDRLFATALAAGPRLDQAFTEIVLADDDDGIPENGTPNLCEIETAFGAHGLSGVSALLASMHAEISGAVDGTAPIAVSAAPPASVGGCAATVESVIVRYRIDGTAAQEVALEPGSGGFAGAIPAPGDGHLVRYWLETELSTGAVVTLPAGAPEYRWAFWTGPTYPVYFEDFESGENGWTHGGTADDWEVGAPQGNSGDPSDAFSGSSVLGNDLAGRYDDDASNWVESPTIDCRGCSGTRLRLRRWLSVEDGNWDQARILVNGQVVWQNPAADGWGGPAMRDPIWSYEDLDISSIADGEKITIRFELVTDQAFELGGWNLDDIEVVSLDEPADVGGGNGRDTFWSCAVSGTQSAGTSGGMMLMLLAATAVLRKRREPASRRSCLVPDDIDP